MLWKMIIILRESYAEDADDNANAYDDTGNNDLCCRGSPGS